MFANSKIRNSPSEEIHDCIACVLRPLLTMGSICGLSPFYVSCPHTNESKGVARFQKSYFFIILSTISSLCALLNITQCIVDLFAPKQNTMRLLQIVVELLLSVGAAVSTIFSSIQSQQRLDELNGLSLIFESRHYYGINSFFTVRTTRIFRRRSKLLMMVVVLVASSYFLYALAERQDHATHAIILRASVVGLCTYVQLVIIFQCMIATCIYVTLYKRCFFRIEKLLSKKLDLCIRNPYFNQERVMQVVPPELPLELSLQRLNRLCMGLTRNYQQLALFLNPSFTFWWLVLMITLVLSFYYMIIVYSHSQIGDTLIASRSFGSVCGITVYLAIVERLNIVVRFFSIY